MIISLNIVPPSILANPCLSIAEGVSVVEFIFEHIISININITPFSISLLNWLTIATGENHVYIFTVIATNPVTTNTINMVYIGVPKHSTSYTGETIIKKVTS